MASTLPWLEAAGVAVMGVAGGGLGGWCSRRPGRWWLAAYFLPLVAVLMCGATFRYRPLELMPPFSWLTAGRREYVVLAFCGSMVFGALLPRLRDRRQRRMVWLLVAIIVLVEAAWPFLAPAFNRARLAALVTRVDTDGVCLQSTDYTCGPAAAVTALRRLNFAAEEGELAILFSTTASTGTPADVAAARLNAHYGEAGLEARHETFASVAELRGRTPSLAWMKFALLMDHVVAVLEVTEDAVVVADPFRGKRRLSHREFERDWRYVAVTLSRAD